MSQTGKTFIKIATWTTMAQVASLCVSVGMSLLLPKFISIENYAYWQLFVLYSSYIGILHFGFNDGAYLKLGGRKFSEIDKKEWVPQYILIFIVQIIGAIVLFCIGLMYVVPGVRQHIIYLLSFYVIIENCYKILGFTSMATDRMIFYSATVIVDRMVLFLLLIGIIFNFIPVSSMTIILCFIATRSIAFILLLVQYKDFFIGWYRLSFKDSLYNMGSNMQLGIILTISNLLATFIIGSGRFFVEHYWDIKTFAKISLAVSISMFMLVFISQIGMILFPMLRNMNTDRLRIILGKGFFLLGFVSLICYLGFFPIYGFVKLWLPKYVESLSYLVFLFPISLYEVKSNLLYSTYLKNLYKQKVLCIINLITILMAVVLYWIACRMQNIEMIVITMLVSIMFKSIVSLIYLLRYYSIRLPSFFYIEIGISILFILVFKYFGISYLLIIYAISLLLLLIAYRTKLIQEYRFVKQVIN